MCGILALFMPWDNDEDEIEDDEAMCASVSIPSSRLSREIDTLWHVLDDAILLCVRERRKFSRRGRKSSIRDGLRTPKTTSTTTVEESVESDEAHLYRACAFVRLWTAGLLRSPTRGRAVGREEETAVKRGPDNNNDGSRIFPLHTKRWPSFLFVDGDDQNDVLCLRDLAFSDVQKQTQKLARRFDLYKHTIEAFARGTLSLSFSWDDEKKECYMDAASAKTNRSARVPVLHVQGKIVATHDDEALAVEREGSLFYFSDAMRSDPFPGGSDVLARLQKALVAVLRKQSSVPELELYRVAPFFGHEILRYALGCCRGVRRKRTRDCAYWSLDPKW
eukprot:g5408.t1